MRTTLVRLFVATIMLLCAQSGSIAQYYEESQESSRSATGFGSLGMYFRDFSPLSSNPLRDTASIQYHAIMPVIAMHQGLIELLFGYTRYTMDNKSLEAILFSVTLTQDFRLIGSRESNLGLLGTLTSDFTKSEATGPSRETFNVASVGAGLGLRYRFVSQSSDAVVSGTFSAQYSSEGFGAGTGFSTLTLGESVFLLKSIRVVNGIALGYRLRYQTWSMSEEKFNYSSLSHGPFIGLIL